MLRLLAILLAFWLILDDARAQGAPPPGEAPAAAALTPLETRARDLLAVINGEKPSEEVFSVEMQRAVPPASVAAISKQITDQFGAALAVESVTPASGTTAIMKLRLERAIASGPITIDPAQDNRVSGFRLTKFEPFGDSVEAIRADLEALPGTVSAYFGPLDGAPARLAINVKDQMPLGSTMKLYVLAQLGREIAQGKRAWGDVVTLDQQSFPSGQLQEWPQGAPLTLHSLASLMISISDNTATDQLIRVLGETAMADILQRTAHGDRALNAPWMTTRELFLLKGGDRDRLALYAKASPDVRRQILAGLEENPASAAQVEAVFLRGPTAIDVEWFASARDLARLFEVMIAECDPAVFDIMAINTNASPVAADNWDYIGYKGGSEPGVLNLTWLLRDEAGEMRMLSLGWSNAEAVVDEDALNAIGQRLLSLPQ